MEIDRTEEGWMETDRAEGGGRMEIDMAEKGRREDVEKEGGGSRSCLRRSVGLG